MKNILKIQKTGNPARSVPLFLPKVPVLINREGTQRGIPFIGIKKYVVSPDSLAESPPVISGFPFVPYQFLKNPITSNPLRFIGFIFGCI